MVELSQSSALAQGSGSANATARAGSSPTITLGEPELLPGLPGLEGRRRLRHRHHCGHLLKDKTGRKLLSIEPAKGAAGRLIVRFVSPGKWNPDVEQEDSAGYTVWGRKQDNSLRAIHVESVDDAVERSVATGAP